MGTTSFNVNPDSQSSKESCKKNIDRLETQFKSDDTAAEGMKAKALPPNQQSSKALEDTITATLNHNTQQVTIADGYPN